MAIMASNKKVPGNDGKNLVHMPLQKEKQKQKQKQKSGRNLTPSTPGCENGHEPVEVETKSHQTSRQPEGNSNSTSKRNLKGRSQGHTRNQNQNQNHKQSSSKSSDFIESCHTFSDDERSSQCDRVPSQKSMASTASTTATSLSISEREREREREREHEQKHKQHLSPLSPCASTSARPSNSAATPRRRQKQSNSQNHCHQQLQTDTKSIASLPSLASFETEDFIENYSEDTCTDGTLALKDDNDDYDKDNSSPSTKKGGRKIKRVLKRQDSDLSQDSTIHDSVGSFGNLHNASRRRRQDCNKIDPRTDADTRTDTHTDAHIGSNNHMHTDNAKENKNTQTKQEAKQILKPARKKFVQSEASSGNPRKNRDPNSPKSERRPILGAKSASERKLSTASASASSSGNNTNAKSQENIANSPRTTVPGERRMRKGAKKGDLTDLIQSDHITDKTTARSPRKSHKGRRLLSDPGMLRAMSPSVSPRKSISMVGDFTSTGTASTTRVTSIDENKPCNEPEPEISLDAILGSQPALDIPMGIRSIQSEPGSRRMLKGGSSLVFSKTANTIVTKCERISDRPRKSRSQSQRNLYTDEKVQMKTESEELYAGTGGVERKTSRGKNGGKDDDELRISKHSPRRTRPTFERVASDRFLDMSSSSFAVNDLPPQIGSRLEAGSEFSLHQRTMAAEGLKEIMNKGRADAPDRMRVLSRSPSRGRRRNTEDLHNSTRITTTEMLHGTLALPDRKANRNELFDMTQSERIPGDGTTHDLKVPKRHKSPHINGQTSHEGTIGNLTNDVLGKSTESNEKAVDLQILGKVTMLNFGADDDWECATHTSGTVTPQELSSSKREMVVSQRNLVDGVVAKVSQKTTNSETSAAESGILSNPSQSYDSQSLAQKNTNKKLNEKKDGVDRSVSSSPRKIKFVKKNDEKSANKAKSRWTTLRNANDFIQAAKRKLTVDEFLECGGNNEHVEAPQIEVGGIVDVSPVTLATKYVSKPTKRKGKKLIAPKL